MLYGRLALPSDCSHKGGLKRIRDLIKLDGYRYNSMNPSGSMWDR
jgi:hypothetical protein